ncbi:hypothetical protein V8E54_007758 [Elaphomyces granulatus]
MTDMETQMKRCETMSQLPDGPKLTHNTDDTMEDCIAQCHELRMALIKNSHDLITDLCKHVDLVNKTLDECGRYRE